MQQDPAQPLLHANNTAKLILSFTVVTNSHASNPEQLTPTQRSSHQQPRAAHTDPEQLTPTTQRSSHPEQSCLGQQENAALCSHSRRQSFVVTGGRRGKGEAADPIKPHMWVAPSSPGSSFTQIKPAVLGGQGRQDSREGNTSLGALLSQQKTESEWP